MLTFLRQYNFRFRLRVLVVVAALAIIAVTLVTSLISRNNMMNEKFNTTRELVEVATHIVQYYYDQASSGKMDEKQAKDLALTQLKTLRYNQEDYFWVNDTTPTMLMHPTKPALDGKDLSGVKDPYGTYLFNDMVKVVKTSGGGFVPYYWPKPGHDKPVSKISYVHEFKPWGWIIGTGIYIDDVDAQFYHNMLTAGGVAAFVVFILFLISIAINASVLTPLQELVSTMKNLSRGDGNLTVRLDTRGKDEISQLSHDFNLFIEKLAGIIQALIKTISELNQVSEDVGQFSSEVKQRSHEQHEESRAINRAFSEMSIAIENVARSAENAASAASAADQTANAGQQMVKDTVESTRQLAREVQSAGTIISDLEAKSDAIGSVLDVIRGIAEQTNLLALNAAIEAARAGEQGRGFAVVADEVRTLASRTQQSTEEIHAMISSLQDGTRNMVEAINRSRSLSDRNVEFSSRSGETLNSITQAVQTITDLNHQIASAAEEQAQVSMSISRSIDHVNSNAERGVNDAEHSADISARVHSLSGRMQELANQFRV